MTRPRTTLAIDRWNPDRAAGDRSDPAKGPVGKTLGDLALAWGIPTLFVLFSLFGMWLALEVVRRRPPAIR